MPAKPLVHPTPEQLAAYARGKLTETAIAAVDAHLEDCPACRQAVERVPADSFLDHVQAAGPRRTGTHVASDTSRPGLTPNPSLPGLPTPTAGPEPAPPDLPPELANHPKFRILKELGRGGMGVVYQAEHRLMDNLVAIKVINPAVLDHPEALTRFHTEVKAAAKLVHPNIVRALDADRAGELHLLVMEFVEGLDLAKVVEKKGPLPVAHACHYVRQAALGLQHAFEQGMVHRDIKPQNLMLSPRGQIKILDFGLARVRSEPGKNKQQLTRLDSFMGTPAYVAPEQATDAHSADQRADIYSLGCTLYCLLTGHPPFQEDTPVKIILAHLEKEPRPVHAARPEVPAELSAVVAKMLAKAPSQRYQTPVEVFQALAPFIKTTAKPGRSGAGGGSSVSPSSTQGTILPNDTSRLPALSNEKVAKSEVEAAPVTGLNASDVGAAEPRPRGRSKAARKGVRRWIPAVAVSVLAVAGLVWGALFLRVRTPEGMLELHLDPPDAEVHIDDKKVEVRVPGDNEPVRIEWPAGKHQVKVTRTGFQVVAREVTLKAGQSASLRVKLMPMPAEKAEEPKRKDALQPGSVWVGAYNSRTTPDFRLSIRFVILERDGDSFRASQENDGGASVLDIKGTVRDDAIQWRVTDMPRVRPGGPDKNDIVQNTRCVGRIHGDVIVADFIHEGKPERGTFEFRRER